MLCPLVSYGGGVKGWAIVSFIGFPLYGFESFPPPLMIFLANQHSKISDIDGKLIYSDNEMEITNFVMLLELRKKREFGLTRIPNVVVIVMSNDPEKHF